MEEKEKNVSLTKGDYIYYALYRYSVLTEYISVVKSFQNNIVNEYCCAIIKSQDEDLTGQINYEESFDITDGAITNLRKATEEEKIWFDEYLFEMDNIEVSDLFNM